ncbi:6338_t:CDS:2 [Rhizophagus irregularis]|nr:6338_t:CDS:2 [Rhizophagus irregularis]
MKLTSLLGGRRRSEPKHLLGIKLFTMIMLIACLTGYLAVLIIDVNQGASIIVTSYFNVDGVRPPNLHFSGVYNASITGCVEARMVNKAFVPVDCLGDMKQSYDEKSKKFLIDYQPSKDVFFSKGSLYNIVLFFLVYEEITLEKPWEMFLAAYDSERDFYYQNPSDDVDDMIFAMNTYNIAPNQDYRFTYSNIIREAIVPSWMNDFGVPPTYEQKPYITSNLVGGPLQNKNSDGAKTLQPWGVVQSYCCGFSRLTQKKLKNSLPIVPFSDDHNTKGHQINSLSLAEQNKLLLSRLNNLESFLQEYVVDVKYLDRIRDNMNTANNTGDNQNTNSESSTLGTISSHQ